MCPHEALRSILSALSQEVSHVCKDAGTEQSVSVCVCVSQVVGAQQLCGNALVEGLEQCDDGNTSPGDGCSPTCQVGRLLMLQSPWSPFSCFLLSRALSHGRLLVVPFSCSHLMLPSYQTGWSIPHICSQAKQHVVTVCFGDAVLQCTCEPCMDPTYCFTLIHGLSTVLLSRVA